MGKYVDQKFVASMVQFYYNERKNHYHRKCYKCKHLENLIKQMDKWSFYTLNVHYSKWFFIYNFFDSKVTLFPVFI